MTLKQARADGSALLKEWPKTPGQKVPKMGDRTADARSEAEEPPAPTCACARHPRVSASRPRCGNQTGAERERRGGSFRLPLTLPR